jgi:RNA polymerase sigma-70 factor (ECF subfamily)
MGDTNNNIFFTKIKTGDASALKNLFDAYYAVLCRYANRIVNDGDQAEEIVQSLFVKIWEKRHTLNIHVSEKSYLFRAVRNRCINLLQQEKVKQQHAQQIKEALQNAMSIENDTDNELEIQIEAGIEMLPEKRREIFRLSREKGLKYREIAAKLNISVKTVETQMGLALKTLREFIQRKR